MGKETLDMIGRSEHQELLVGTWLAMAIIADQLIEGGVIDRQSLLATLTDAEEHCRGTDLRYRAIGAVRRTLEMLPEPNHLDAVPAAPRHSARAPKRSAEPLAASAE